ncbi:hypothetical protein FZC78_19255 [Rossellomorea vietnamensis]|uniref:Uncharacterized protein n=1 Tax=Rossellomorea vietnamensis TaxID=218284 RepID=A0A5D4NJ65_9BACI|nr:hypothetical protein [Rossellomorea vietnamensis]TYS14293.1 hypothetical protein FZC78_19255 [Rossellomorea vietnamensis]
MMDEKIKAYQEHSSTFAQLQLQRAQKERDMLKLKYEKADFARFGWKLASVALAAFIVGQWLG